MSSPSRRSRWLHGGLVSLLGVLALVLPAADLSPRVPDPWGPETIAGDFAVVGLAIPLIVGGGWLAMRDWEPQHTRSVLVRTYVATIVAGVLAGWATVLWVTGDPTQYVVAIDGVLIAALVTFATAVLSIEETRVAEANRRGEAAARELAEDVIDCSTDPTLIVDADGVVRWLNETAATTFDIDSEQAVGRDRDAVVADVLEPVAIDGSCCTEYHVRTGSRCAHRLTCRCHDIDDGLYADGRIEQYSDVTEERNAVEALKSIGALASDSTATASPPTELLDAGRELLDAEYAAYTRVDEGRTIESVRSDRVDPTDDDSVPTLHVRSVREVRDAGAARTGYLRSDGGTAGAFEFDHGAASFDAFVAAPAEVGDEVVGVVTFLRRSPESFSGWERAVTELLAEWSRERLADERYERALEHERERLEFVNRIVRHNVLNGLNLVNARLDHLDSGATDAEAEEHLSVVQHRVDEMADLIDTIRAFMDAALSDREHALEPVPIRAVLEEELSAAAKAEGASLRVHDLPDDDVRVTGDELTSEVIANVLQNAVEHSDREQPTVEVWTSRSSEALPLGRDSATAPTVETSTDAATAENDEQPVLTVHVADDGPGIPDEQKRRLLQHGDADLGDTGHGFGFYLARETMESYGGGVGIRDNDPRGAVIDLVFPVASSA